VYVLVFACLTGLAICRADELAAVTGLVTDPNGRSVPGVTIIISNLATNVASRTVTNDQGIYRVPSLQPGIYRMTLDKDGFKSIVKSGVELHIQDVASINFELQIGSVNETVTVEAGASMINTTSAAVGTVVDQTYVKNMPLNGRSFQDLILLTPGVVTNSPQAAASSIGQSGEFSVNGQRTESNYYTVDGVSANVGIVPTQAFPPASSGSLPASTTLGTTQAIVSVDALQEFRVQSSTYSAEYGRNPGGQFSFATRSGTNQWRGTAFDYLRNDFCDANDWFNDFLRVPEPPVRQNDFGGTVGGPIAIPRLYNGRDKTFFFFSYEGLRLIQPQAADLSLVPTLALRQSAPSGLQPVLNAFTLPHCPANATPATCSTDLGDGTGNFLGSWSNPNSLDVVSVRLDHMVNAKLRFFFRFSNASSTSDSRSVGSNSGNPANLNTASFTTRTYTFGATSLLTNRVSNELRFNYSTNAADSLTTLTSFGGAKSADFFQLQGFPGKNNPAPQIFLVFLFGSSPTSLGQSDSSGEQRQWNLVDTVSLSLGKHQLKSGIDFRRLEPRIQPNSPVVGYLYFSSASVTQNAVDVGFASSKASAFPVYTNFSAFVEDEWKLTPRLNLSIGVRWEVNPAPGSAKGMLPYTVQGGSLATLSLAPQGTPLWHTSWYNFAPRLGVAYVLRNTPNYETVVRGGGGLFFDTGQQLGSEGYNGPGFSSPTFNFGSFVNPPNAPPSRFPLPPDQVNPPIVNPPVPPFTNTPVFAFPSHLQLPYTLQWNASIQQALSKSQTLTFSYVGSHAARLLVRKEVNVPPVINPNFPDVFFNQSGLTGDYNALQSQFQRRLTQGLQALASYTWSHSIDYGSQNLAFPSVRGNSDFDVRHTFSAALSYDLPSRFSSRFADAVLGHWGLDDRFTARTAFPISLAGPVFIDAATGQRVDAGVSIKPGIPFYVHGSQYPGGRAINGTIVKAGCPGGSDQVGPFCPPAGCPDFSFCPAPAQGDAPRNFLRGFGAWQMDLAVRREFPIHERVRLQFRAEAFNIFNHPNFGFIQPFFGDPRFGRATATLAQSLGVLSGLYQMGGPRSMQFALKLMF